MAVMKTIEKISDHIDPSDIVPGSLLDSAGYLKPGILTVGSSDVKIEPYVSPGIIGGWPDSLESLEKSGVKLIYHGCDLGDIEKIIDDVNGANQNIKKWDLPGVEDIQTIKRAPREITKIMLGAVTRIAMYRSTLDVAFKFEQEIWDTRPGCKHKSLDRPGFMMALAYDAMKFNEDDIDDPLVREIYHQLWSRRIDMSAELESNVAKIEKKAVGGK